MIEELGTSPSMSSLKLRRFYQPELDGLRFYAFLAVFVCHTLPLDESFYRRLHLPMAWLWAAAIRSGGAGVDLFFALSAFLITSLLLRERQETGGIALPFFYIRRILRIWPLYFLLVILGIVFAHPIPHHNINWYYTQSLPWYHVFGYLLFIGNWMYAIFGVAQSVCAPLWTVSIEEQFYLVWPAVMRMLGRRGLIIAGLVTFLAATTSQLGSVLFGASGAYISFGSLARSNSLALGILLGLFANNLPKLNRSLARLLIVSTALAGWIVSSGLFVDELGPATMRMAVGRLIVSLASGALLYGCLDSRSKLVTGAWVVQLGKISYGLYMLHFVGLLTALTLFHSAHGLMLLAVKGLGFVITIVLASISYRWIESPFLRLKDRYARVLSRPV